MATVSDIVRRVLTKLRVYQPGEDISSEDFNDVLREMNAFLNYLGNQKLTGPYLSRLSVALSSGDGTYTIGPSGASIIAPQPVRIDGVIIRDTSSNDTVLQQISRNEYNEITLKTEGPSTPCVFYYEQGASVGTIYLHPTPTSGTLLVDAWYQFANYSNPSDDVSLPLGYDDMIVYNLCVRCAPDFGANLYPEIREMAKKSLYNIKFINCLDIPITRTWPGNSYDIERGY